MSQAIGLWIVLVLLLHGLRAYCVLTIRSCTPGLYERLGRPEPVSRYSWGFLQNGAQDSEFAALPRASRYAFRAAQALFVVIVLLSLLVLVLVARQKGWF